jgi:hypothetical protein
MLRLRRTINHKLCQANRVHTSYRIQYHETDGFLLFSQNKIRVISEIDGTYISVLELPYEHIVAISVEARHRITLVDNKGGRYSFVTHARVTAYTIEADLKSRIAPLDYPQLG